MNEPYQPSPEKQSSSVESDAQLPKEQPKQRRGFRAMSPEKQKEIASLGGKAAHAKGTAHVWSSEEAKEAGRKGGRKNAEKAGLREKSSE